MVSWPCPNYSNKADTLTCPILNTAMNNTIKISSEFPKQLARVCAELLREGIRFDVVESGAEWIIELKGY